MEIFTEVLRIICKTFGKISRVVWFCFVFNKSLRFYRSQCILWSLTDDILHFANKVLQDVQQTNELLQQSNKWGPEKVNALLKCQIFYKVV